MSGANLTRYEVEMCHCALGEHMETVARPDGEFVKFEDVAELLKQTNNKQSTQSPRVCPDDCHHMHNGFCGVDCEPMED